MTPGVEGRAPIMKTEFDVIAGLKKIPEEYESAVKQLRKKIKSYEMRQALKNPIKPIREDPLKVFFISVPAGLVFLFFGLRLHPFTGDLNMWVTQVDDYFFMTLVVIFLPFAIFHELKQRQEKKVMKLIPDFLNKLASTNETGMTLYQSIGLLAKTDTSPLRPHVEKIWKDIDWGQTLTDAFIRFANRLKVYALSRTVTLIIEAMKSSGNVTEVLMISAKDATNAEIMRKERSTNMLIYVMIIYISFFVFIGIVYILSSSFLSVIAESSKSFSTMGNVGGLSGLATFDYEYYKRIFMHAAVLQGFSSGLVAGVMGEGSVPAGFKHSVIMLTIGYLLFTLFI
jgi:flagellar protein FlaJ